MDPLGPDPGAGQSNTAEVATAQGEPSKDNDKYGNDFYSTIISETIHASIERRDTYATCL